LRTEEELPVWWPFPRPIFTFLIIDPSGVPILEYPPPSSNADVSKTVLVSGLLTAVNNFAKEIGAGDINDMTFGSYLVTISKGPNDTLCVLLCDTSYIKDNKEAANIHVELKSLTFSRIPNIYKIDYIDGTKDKLLRETFEPYYKLKVKQYKERFKNL